MPITVLCSECSTRLTLADDRAATTMSCPRCGAEVRVPGTPIPSHPLPPPPARPASTPLSLEDEENWSAEDNAARQAFVRKMGIYGGAALFVFIILAVLLSRDRAPTDPGSAKDTDRAASPAKPSTPVTETERKAIGTWTASEHGESLTLRDNHTFQMLDRHGDRVNYDLKGEWRIEGETLLLRVTEMSQPNASEDIFRDLGDLKVDVPLTIISQGDNKMMLRTKSGKRIFVYMRF